MKIYLVILFLLISACVSPPPPLAQLPLGSRIGIYVEYPDFICHEHFAVTAFGNFTKVYEVNGGINAAVLSGYSEAFSSAGYEPKALSQRDFYGGHTKTIYLQDGWNGTYVLEPDYQRDLIEFSRKNGIDLIFVGFYEGPDLEEMKKKPKNCWNFGYTTDFSISSTAKAKVHAPNLLAINPLLGEVVEYRLGDPGLVSQIVPEEMRTVTGREIEQLLSDFKENARQKGFFITKQLLRQVN